MPLRINFIEKVPVEQLNTGRFNDSLQEAPIPCKPQLAKLLFHVPEHLVDSCLKTVGTLGVHVLCCYYTAQHLMWQHKRIVNFHLWMLSTLPQWIIGHALLWEINNIGSYMFEVSCQVFLAAPAVAKSYDQTAPASVACWMTACRFTVGFCVGQQCRSAELPPRLILGTLAWHQWGRCSLWGKWGSLGLAQPKSPPYTPTFVYWHGGPWLNF